MSEFKARLVAPTTTDLHWINIHKGGYNPCILIKDKSVLPNCTGYAWGRFMEITGKAAPDVWSNRNAEDWYGCKDGLKRGSEPKLGAVICWKKGKLWTEGDGAGHVAIVEQINADGSIFISQSGYHSSRFWTSKVKKGYALSGYDFLGFIYPPEKQSTAKKSNAQIAKEVIAGKWGNGTARNNKLTSAGYDYKAIQELVNKAMAKNIKSSASAKKTNAQIAKEVIAGKWGNGQERKDRLTAAGYNYKTIQTLVNKEMK